MQKKRVLSPEFKAKVALAALKGDKTLAEISSQYKVHNTQINRWRKQVLAGLPDIFSKQKKDLAQQEQEALVEDLYKEIGKLRVEGEWLKKKADLFAS
jgi:transposase-like protein